MKLSVDILRDQELLVIPSDKDGGFAATSCESMVEAVDQILVEPKYKHVIVFDESTIDPFELYKEAALAVLVVQRCERLP